MQDYITYEHPLNERVRTFLRIEYLFDEVDHFIEQKTAWESRSAMGALIDIVDFLTRTDIKSELIKELERDANKLTQLKSAPGVDHHRLTMILDDINTLLDSLKDKTYQPGQSIRKDEFIMAVKQRIAIPGGSCSFDLPSYYHWLNTGAVEKLRHFDRWQEDLQVIKESIKLSLNMIRNSADPGTEIAEGGFYQKSVDADTACQLIRVVLPRHSAYFPEISGGKQRFTIRFMEFTENNDRPSQSGEDIQFELHCCNL